DGKKGFLRNVDLADRLHPLFTFLLLFPQLALAADVAAVALGRDVLPHGANRFAGDDLAPDGGLKRHLEHVPRDFLLELFDDGPAANFGVTAVADGREGV